MRDSGTATEAAAHTPAGGPDMAGLRRTISATAAALARTEDQAAATFDLIGQTRPQAADRMRAHAEHARRFASRLRQLATRYRTAGIVTSSDGRS